MTDVLHPPLPDELQIEATGACNLRCRMCLVRYRAPVDRHDGSLSFDAFRGIVDAHPELRRVTLQGLGEPLLAPDLWHMIDYAIERGITVGFNTNATLITEERAARLVRSGVAWIHVSIDGATRETFEHVRDGARFDRVVRNLRRLVAARADAGSHTPRIQMNTVVMQRNLQELPDVVRLAASIPVDRVWVQNLSHDFSDAGFGYDEIREFTAAEALWARPGEVERVFDATRLEARAAGLDLRLPGSGSDDEDNGGRRSAGTPGCDWPWRGAFVTATGRVQPCCMVMGAERALLGDLAEQSLDEIWDNDAYVDFRRRLLTADDPPDVCRGCSQYRHVF